MRCGKHLSEQRSFCALKKGHKGKCDPFPEQQGAYPKSKRVRCLGWTVGHPSCGSLLSVKNLVYIQTHWYTEPYGCVSGDYWNEGEGQFVCSKCERLNRLYERPKVQAMKKLFKEVKDEYKR